MKIGKYETNKENIIKMSNVIDELSGVCADMHHELETYSYDELCCVQMLLWDICDSTIQRFRTNNWQLNLKSGVEQWRNENDILDILKTKIKNKTE